MGKKYTATRIAQFLGVSVTTLKNWYRWYDDTSFKKPKGTPCLPQPERNGPTGIRYWDEDDLYDLKKFQEWVPKGRNGVMGESNARFWGGRGKRALKNKEAALQKQE